MGESLESFFHDWIFSDEFDIPIILLFNASLVNSTYAKPKQYMVLVTLGHAILNDGFHMTFLYVCTYLERVETQIHA